MPYVDTAQHDLHGFARTAPQARQQQAREICVISGRVSESSTAVLNLVAREDGTVRKTQEDRNAHALAVTSPRAWAPSSAIIITVVNMQYNTPY